MGERGSASVTQTIGSEPIDSLPLCAEKRKVQIPGHRYKKSTLQNFNKSCTYFLSCLASIRYSLEKKLMKESKLLLSFLNELYQTIYSCILFCSKQLQFFLWNRCLPFWLEIIAELGNDIQNNNLFRESRKRRNKSVISGTTFSLSTVSSSSSSHLTKNKIIASGSKNQATNNYKRKFTRKKEISNSISIFFSELLTEPAFEIINNWYHQYRFFIILSSLIFSIYIFLNPFYTLFLPMAFLLYIITTSTTYIAEALPIFMRNSGILATVAISWVCFVLQSKQKRNNIHSEHNIVNINNRQILRNSQSKPKIDGKKEEKNKRSDIHLNRKGNGNKVNRKMIKVIVSRGINKFGKPVRYAVLVEKENLSVFLHKVWEKKNKPSPDKKIEEDTNEKRESKENFLTQERTQQNALSSAVTSTVDTSIEMQVPEINISVKTDKHSELIVPFVSKLNELKKEEQSIASNPSTANGTIETVTSLEGIIPSHDKKESLSLNVNKDSNCKTSFSDSKINPSSEKKGTKKPSVKKSEKENCKENQEDGKHSNCTKDIRNTKEEKGDYRTSQLNPCQESQPKQSSQRRQKQTTDQKVKEKKLPSEKNHQALNNAIHISNTLKYKNQQAYDNVEETNDGSPIKKSDIIILSSSSPSTPAKKRNSPPLPSSSSSVMRRKKGPSTASINDITQDKGHTNSQNNYAHTNNKKLGSYIYDSNTGTQSLGHKPLENISNPAISNSNDETDHSFRKKGNESVRKSNRHNNSNSNNNNGPKYNNNNSNTKIKNLRREKSNEILRSENEEIEKMVTFSRYNNPNALKLMDSMQAKTTKDKSLNNSKKSNAQKLVLPRAPESQLLTPTPQEDLSSFLSQRAFQSSSSSFSSSSSTTSPEFGAFANKLPETYPNSMLYTSNHSLRQSRKVERETLLPLNNFNTQSLSAYFDNANNPGDNAGNNYHQSSKSVTSNTSTVTNIPFDRTHFAPDKDSLTIDRPEEYHSSISGEKGGFRNTMDPLLRGDVDHHLLERNVLNRTPSLKLQDNGNQYYSQNFDDTKSSSSTPATNFFYTTDYNQNNFDPGRFALPNVFPQLGPYGYSNSNNDMNTKEYNMVQKSPYAPLSFNGTFKNENFVPKPISTNTSDSSSSSVSTSPDTASFSMPQPGPNVDKSQLTALSVLQDVPDRSMHMFHGRLLTENTNAARINVHKDFINVSRNIEQQSSNNSLFNMNHFPPSFDTDTTKEKRGNNLSYQANEGDVEADLQAKASEILKNILDY